MMDSIEGAHAAKRNTKSIQHVDTTRSSLLSPSCQPARRQPRVSLLDLKRQRALRTATQVLYFVAGTSSPFCPDPPPFLFAYSATRDVTPIPLSPGGNTSEEATCPSNKFRRQHAHGCTHDDCYDVYGLAEIFFTSRARCTFLLFLVLARYVLMRRPLTTMCAVTDSAQARCTCRSLGVP
jgi:hypothetical protein